MANTINPTPSNPFTVTVFRGRGKGRPSEIAHTGRARSACRMRYLADEIAIERVLGNRGYVRIATDQGASTRMSWRRFERLYFAA